MERLIKKGVLFAWDGGTLEDEGQLFLTMQVGWPADINRGHFFSLYQFHSLGSRCGHAVQ